MYLGQTPPLVLLPQYEPEIPEPRPPDDEYVAETPPWYEEPPYTLPIEIFREAYPILVGRPEPEYMPIGRTLPDPPAAPEMEHSADWMPLVVGALILGAVLAFGSSRRG